MDTLGTYRIIRKLGEGSGGVVYLAYHTRLEKEVVLKEIKNQHSNKNNRREVDILKRLHHTYLPQVFDFIEMNGHVYTVMSYIPGKSFQDLIKQGYRFKQSQLRRWAMQLCSALHYLHGQNPPIVHSDIKPANIMLTPQGNICLIDFNISFFLDGTTMIGYTNGYSSPEQKTIASQENVKDLVLDDKTDIYSVGAVLYYLITGKKIRSEEGYRLDTALLESRVSQSFANIIYKATAYQKEERYQSAYEMLKALQMMPKMDERYKNIVKTHKIALGSTVGLLVVSIILLGLGIHQVNLEKVDQYNTLVQQQINYREKGKYQKEEETYKKATSLMSSPLESYYQNALSLYEKGDYKKCIEFIEQDVVPNVNMMQEGNADLMYVKSCSYFELGKYHQAVKSYETLFKYGSSNYLHYRDYAITLAYDNNESQADKILQKAINKGMKEDSIYYARAEIAKAMNRDDEAINNFKLCLKKTDNDTLKERSYILMSDIYKNQNNLTECRQVLKEASEALPMNKQIISIERLIQVDIDLADKNNDRTCQQEAIELLNKVINNHWDTYDTYDNLVILNEKMGNYSSADQYLSELEKKYGTDYNIYKRKAFLQVELQKEKANENRDYTLFKRYYDKAQSLYQKESQQDDDEMQLLDTVYQQVLQGGWLN